MAATVAGDESQIAVLPDPAAGITHDRSVAWSDAELTEAPDGSRMLFLNYSGITADEMNAHIVGIVCHPSAAPSLLPYGTITVHRTGPQ